MSKMSDRYRIVQRASTSTCDLRHLQRNGLETYGYSYIIEAGRFHRSNDRSSKDILDKGGGGMNNYDSIREAAEKWGVSERRINQYCSQGRIPGAKKFGKSWAIPADAQKPKDPRQVKGRKAPSPHTGYLLDHAHLMPLMNTAFVPGRCKEAVEAMAEGIQRDIALAEYHYFSGHPEEAAKEAEKAEFAAWHDSVEKAKKQATEMGVEFINVDVNEFRNKVLPIHQELLNKTPALKPLYEAAEKANQQ